MGIERVNRNRFRKKCIFHLSLDEDIFCDSKCIAFRGRKGCLYLASLRLVVSDRNLSGSLVDRQSSLEDLIVENFNHLKSYCNKLVRRYELGEEVCQEVLRRALENKEKIKPDQPVLPWLLRIAKNIIIDRYRKEKVEKLDLIENIELEGNLESWNSESLDYEIVSLLSISSLTERQRKAVELVYIDNCSIEEGAEIMGLSYKGFYSLLRRALETMKKEMKDLI